ncbi:hypothetical protein PUR49_07790 [Streptomyces sp. BE147]|uniref:hypothetical protein n=1 Tax=Streptomyces sp. BE147 TaxID=3002524 RepID=UPI002E7709F5|nr:hypothetical protein [Streptomyces sp. BE147]MEE1736401.1 hypothetical protein [Streptomyces sp. BE147]
MAGRNAEETQFEVVLRFTAGGPAVTGAWTSAAAAAVKFRFFVGLYGDHPTVTITLTASAPQRQRPRVLRTWTREHGEVVAA